MCKLSCWPRRVFFTLSLTLLVIPIPVMAASILFVTDDSPSRLALMSQLRPLFTETSAVKPISNDDTPFSVFLAFDALGTAISVSETGTKQQRLQRVMNAKSVDLSGLCRQVDVVVVAGAAATRWVRGLCRRPLLMVFTSRYRVDEILREAEPGLISAIYLEADPLLNLGLISQALQSSATVGVLVSERSQGWLTRLRPAAERLGLTLEIIPAQDDEDAVRLLRQRIDVLDALLLIPDENLINGWSLKPILLMTARQFIPVFGGATEQYVKAGTTAAVVPNFDDLVVQIKSCIRQLMKGTTMEPSYPTATRIAVNPVVAQALSIDTARLINAHGD